MLIYTRHIVRSMLPPLVMSALIIICLIWSTQVLKLLYLLDKGVKISDFFGVILLIIPYLLFITLPIIAVISTIVTYNKLKQERQLIVLKSSGLSNIAIARPALYVALALMIFSLFNSAYLMPKSYLKLKTNLDFMKNSYVTSLISEKTFNQLSKSLTIYVNKKMRNGKLEGIVIFDNRDGGNNSSILFVQSGHFEFYGNDIILRLTNGTRHYYNSKDHLTKLQFETLTIELKKDHGSSRLNKRDVNELFINELLFPPSSEGLRALSLIAEGHQRILWPLYCFILTLLSLAVFLKTRFNRKAQYSQIIVTLLTVIIFTYFHFTFQNLAAKNLSYLYASYANMIIAMLVSSFLYFS